MTDAELDRVLRRGLLDALRLDEAQAVKSEAVFVPTLAYQWSMSHICKNPLKWMRTREKPVWRRVLQQVAVILIVCSLGFGCVMVASPTARAAVVRWITEWYETHIVYRYSGEPVSEQVPDYTVTALPDGFTEVERITLSRITDVTYTDDNGNVISLSYSVMHQTGGNVFSLENCVLTDIVVNHMEGQFFEAKRAGDFNAITWIDEETDIQFMLFGVFGQTELTHMAESVWPKPKLKNF